MWNYMQEYYFQLVYESIMLCLKLCFELQVKLNDSMLVYEPIMWKYILITSDEWDIATKCLRSMFWLQTVYVFEYEWHIAIRCWKVCFGIKFSMLEKYVLNIWLLCDESYIWHLAIKT